MDRNETNNEEVIVSGWSWLALSGLVLIAICVYCIIILLPVEEPDAYVLVAIAVCGILFALWVMIVMLYRFRIDSEGVYLQRLVRRRFYPWNEIQEVIISARSTKTRWILTAIFCTEVHRPFVKLDVGDFFWPKWCMCVDLSSFKFPASRLFAFVEQDQLLKAIEDHGVKIWYAPIALKVMNDSGKRELWS